MAEQEREISSERREVAAEAQVVRQRFLAEFRDAIEPRTAPLVLGVMLLQFGFIFSYIAAFHAPKPHQIPLAVVAPAPLSRTLVGQLNAIPKRPLLASAETSEGATVRRIVYFGSDGISVHLIVLAAYAIGGVLVTLLASHVNARRIARGAPALR